LRSVFPDLAPELVAACMEAFSLEDAASEKCAFPAGNLCTREALEMASGAVAAALHASLLPSRGVLCDIAAGVGGDALALARRAEGLLCIEADAVHARMLAHNLAQAGRRNALVLRGSAERWLPLLQTGRLAGVFADPARRRDGRRHVGTQEYRPSLEILAQLPATLPVLVKIAPGADPPPGWSVATVAVGGQCLEQLLSRGCDLPPVAALRAEDGARWIPVSRPAVRVDRPRFLIEAHAAIIRTGHVAEYFREHGAEAIDPHIAYGWSGSQPDSSDWHSSFRLLRVEAFNRKRLRRIAAELDFGPETEIKKRGFPDTPEQIRAQIRLRGKRNGVIFLTRRGERHLMLFAERLERE
ncbi:MAG: hypothetical protein RRA94_10660, partial [Bacteroidota bacterium]|nr:hypothetical protein [Bacteroidota bacterium]